MIWKKFHSWILQKKKKKNQIPWELHKYYFRVGIKYYSYAIPAELLSENSTLVGIRKRNLW